MIKIFYFINHYLELLILIKVGDLKIRLPAETNNTAIYITVTRKKRSMLRNLRLRFGLFGVCFILYKYPYANVTFEKAELRTNDACQFYKFAGYSRLAKWPESIATKRLCEIHVDAQSADIIDYNGF